MAEKKSIVFILLQKKGRLTKEKAKNINRNKNQKRKKERQTCMLKNEHEECLLDTTKSREREARHLAKG